MRFIGQDALISYSVICYINTLVSMTMVGITQGVQPLISFNFGARENENVNNLFKIGIKTMFITAITVFALCLLFANNITALFIDTKEVQLFNSTVYVFKLYSFSFLFLGFNLIISGFFVAIDKPICSAIISLGRSLVLVIISLFVLTKLFGGDGIWVTTDVSEFITLIISLSLLFKFFKEGKKNIKNKSSDVIENSFIQ